MLTPHEAPSFQQNYTYKKKYRFDFGLSSNPLGPSPQVLQILCAHPELLSRYPEAGYPILTEKLTALHSCNGENLLIGAGLDGLIYDIMNLFLDKNDVLIIPNVTFRNAIYSASHRGAKISQIPMAADLSVDFNKMINAINQHTKVVFICNPNNPTGIYESIESIIRLLQSTDALVIVDEANIEYSGGSCLHLTEQFSNILVLRTFSKAYGLAGMRIGYGISRSPLVKEISAKRPPFGVTSLSALAASLALGDQEHLNHSVAYIQQECNFLARGLELLGFSIIPSSSNTLLCRIPTSIDRASELVDQLHEYDCHVVNGTSFNLPDCYLRIAPQLHSVNAEFIDILGRIISK